MFRDYLESSRSAVYSILFILPFLLIYEFGIFFGARGQNIGDSFLRLGYYFFVFLLGPTISAAIAGVVIFIAILFVVNQIKEQKIRIRFKYFLLMLAEVLFWTVGIALFLGIFFYRNTPEFFTFQPNESARYMAYANNLRDFWSIFIGSIGAGVFEELVFRVIGIRLLYELFKNKMYPKFSDDQGALLKAIGASALVFTVLHYKGVANPFSLIGIFLMAIIFSFLYLRRGYGIAATTHAFWDLFFFFGILA
ncbi:MAG: hypothetical protein COT81_02015 [Candidatus Buchananbacteria bacterium CG10_big_fil_rev_8_21_14_0_10_42_9]|uniref:CAAX prenyl protease 2/Lysostaphin resistance protein A-like domain-containing protein n=1 Tax=Candidatus Buchananbacteria bacterium CG10_big_fil_rev_8_21_14_0_10_42_9 TaxID=1974526 RepID=A0A2H0W1N6_9BACT|nr:MAG: hypothetical protein COT81_02015 [Candidatus Buchananbacteria bacterium CG10_big_fil_rev_8_21_14_0_10_42_9]